MRIIAGEKRSRRLLTLDGLDTRPTLDRVKEALFSILSPRIPGAMVLDLIRRPWPCCKKKGRPLT